MKKKKSAKSLLALLLALALTCSNLGFYTVDVEAAQKKPTKITLNEKSAELVVGKSYYLKVVSVSPKKASKSVTFTTSNKKVATVNNKGKITAKKAGTATITATSKSNKKVKATCKVTVYSKVKSITLSTTKKELAIGKTFTLKASVKPASSIQNVTYKSANSKIASVTKKGVVTAKKIGKTTITVKSKSNPSVSKKCTIIVKNTMPTIATSTPAPTATLAPTATCTPAPTATPVLTVKPLGLLTRTDV